MKERDTIPKSDIRSDGHETLLVAQEASENLIQRVVRYTTTEITVIRQPTVSQ